MQPFTTHRGLVATLDRANVDTDQIIPKQFLKSIKRTGFGVSLFFDWRYKEDGAPDPEFELNRPEFAEASVLVTRSNFGCGSSREHAVWAVAQYGFRVIVAPWRETPNGRVPGFADIFANNCVKNGVLTIQLSETDVEEIFELSARFPGLSATADLEERRLVLHLDEEVSFHFDVKPEVREYLLRGLDDVALTLDHEADIAAYEAAHDALLRAGAA